MSRVKGTPQEQALTWLLGVAVPFQIELRMRFRGSSTRTGCLIPGPSGWGEFAPFRDYSEHRSARWLAAALEAAFGVWPNARRDVVDVNAIIPAVDAEQASHMTTQAVRTLGCTTIKVKVDGNLQDDEPRVAAVRAALDAHTSDGRIRLDVNGAWSTSQALHDGMRLAAYGLEYIEQPTRDLQGIRALRAQVPIAIDEGIRIDDHRSVSDRADIAIIKVAPLGGVTQSVAIAQSLDVPVVVSGSLDSSIGLAAGIQAAAAMPQVTGACGFGTGALLRTDVVDETTLPVHGQVRVGRRTPDLDALAKARGQVRDEGAIADRVRTAWWAGNAELWTSAVLAAADQAR